MGGLLQKGARLANRRPLIAKHTIWFLDKIKKEEKNI